MINENQKPAQWYAITIPIGKLEQHPEQICFYVAVDWNIYYGFGIMSKSSNIINIEDIDGIIQDAFKDSKYEAIAWRYPQSENGCFDLKIDFKHFNDNAINLIDRTHRKSYAEQLAKEIKNAIQKGADLLKSKGILTE